MITRKEHGIITIRKKNQVKQNQRKKLKITNTKHIISLNKCIWFKFLFNRTNILININALLTQILSEWAQTPNGTIAKTVLKENKSKWI